MEKNQPHIYVSIIEDDALILTSLTQLIDNASGFKVVSSFKTADEALKTFPKPLPDVLLLDIDLPGTSGVEALPQLNKLLPKTNILMLTVNESSDLVFKSLQNGAVGYLLKGNAPSKLLESIREVFNGGSPMSPSIARKVIGSFQNQDPYQLSDREKQVLQKLCNGSNNSKIAEELFVSVNTVKAHIKNIYEKMHVHTRAEVVSKAIKNKIV
ncbi:MAG: response regulator transcription factor [Flavobacteriales bacterium]|nr:response regulator transcription factor [Flavobacteriia bacterium]NCP05775.1 response regulator transcription factor [Flavobacteriales bacterium]PIV93616.1 MAG: DNA-binding response regulator [Flavobacteriaceae bacterium CG17_big_fil_post_rev_8_21_14_2_50_33_15]PIY13038.1 MAG: DNA-binding response regulator [Flavobacteriaceae bacterium CG_4_10_14_3_um_filter_33_47]PJB16699.1 MAG: DNA-binding response regulator [Flavobacteriaceae bacterium CG_4_9_14_3_um_filter_33_16]